MLRAAINSPPARVRNVRAYVWRRQRTVWNMAIMERFHVRPFHPVWWAFNTHAQTVLCNGLNCLDDQLQPFRYAVLARGVLATTVLR